MNAFISFINFSGDMFQKNWFLMIVYKKKDEWYIEWQRVITSATTSENKWQRVTINNNKWRNEWQRVTKSDIDNEWQQWQWVIVSK